MPECAILTNKNSGFIAPTSGRTFDVGESLNITWYGGHVKKGERLTSIFDITLVHGNDKTKSGWTKEIFSKSLNSQNGLLYVISLTQTLGSKAFIFESDRTGRDGVWTNFDICGNTAVYQLWTISADLDFSNTSFALIAKNVTTDAEKSTYISDPFIIREPVVSSTTTSILTSTSISGTVTTTSTGSTGTSSSPSPSTSTSTDTPEPSPQLSSGAKAGIGVGLALFVVIIVLLGWLRVRKRGDRDLDPSGAAAEHHQKSEPEGQGLKLSANEIDGPEIFEADGDNGTKQKTPPQELVELPAEEHQRKM